MMCGGDWNSEAMFCQAVARSGGDAGIRLSLLDNKIQNEEYVHKYATPSRKIRTWTTVSGESCEREFIRLEDDQIYWKDTEDNITSIAWKTLTTKDREHIEKDRVAGDLLVLTVNGVKFPFRWCPAGKFTMGRLSDQEGRTLQLREMTMPHGFWMAETETTQEQWKAVMGKNPSMFKGDDLPVEQVSWSDCRDFINALNKTLSPEGLPPALNENGQSFSFALPTEVQWEYACRAGSKGDYAGELITMAWYDNGNADGREPRKVTHPVARKRPNAWGLYDMHGNVWEWCADTEEMNESRMFEVDRFKRLFENTQAKGVLENLYWNRFFNNF